LAILNLGPQKKPAGWPAQIPTSIYIFLSPSLTLKLIHSSTRLVAAAAAACHSSPSPRLLGRAGAALVLQRCLFLFAARLPPQRCCTGATRLPPQRCPPSSRPHCSVSIGIIALFPFDFESLLFDVFISSFVCVLLGRVRLFCDGYWGQG